MNPDEVSKKIRNYVLLEIIPNLVIAQISKNSKY